MKIQDLLKDVSVDVNAKVSDKDEAITHLIDLMDNQKNLTDKETYKKGIYAREALSTTGIGEGIAIPHAQNEAVTACGLSAMVVKDGVDYASLDGQPAKLFFMIAVPQTGGNEHLEILAMLSTMLMDTQFKDSLINAASKEEFLALINQKETEQHAKEDQKAEASKTFTGTYRLLAVTACPTGIAHTYMAAEALEEKAKEMGITIKVETDGSGGTKNAPSAKEIEECEAIIVAADKNIEMARFNGKPVIQVKVADGINKAEELINQALSGNAPIYHSDHAVTAQSDESGESVGRQIYKHLMNGVSHMLPFVIGGGILIALAFLFDDYTIDPSNFGKNTELAAFFKTAGDTAFNFMLPVLSGYIAMSIADRPGLAVGFVGGALASAGNSGFLGALVAGFAAGYLVHGLRKLFDHLPDAFEGLKPVLLYPFFGILLMAVLMAFIINPPVAAINNGLTDFLNSMGGSSKILLGTLLGAMMAVDMGGPINKAAYVFGTASITSGNYDIMAAVMIGGMVPPLAIALATFFFKNRFTKKEQQTTLTNVIMGFSFITEGAIPFAASDPLHIIPGCVVGSGIAGALSMAFGCTLMAPHGGIFVIGVISNPFGYLAALIIGSIAGMLVLSVLKKPLKNNS
ncbi:PTS fructose transporter subunit IIABC [Absiella sp. AM29-15]|uniref:PTS fructose transporter subunit IIABC n=1 Tax=Absiella sp. AM29-15 TaxID=2292278 RepID=UPI000E40A0EA|nr:PTS fructose transporter subunit IIABC [Absiella sp. AM29-15]RGC52013.1 PTS fructose transporter subunit IIC [Absiella sp. AM29-15]